MVRVKAGLPIFILLILNLACSDSHVLYENNFEIPSSEWAFGHPLGSTWKQDQNLNHVSVVLDIIHAPDFRFQNIYLTGEFKRDESIIWKDTFSIQLARNNSGQWLGRYNEDRLIVSDTIPYAISLNPGERFQYQFSQFSRKEVLEGIDEVKVKIINN